MLLVLQACSLDSSHEKTTSVCKYIVFRVLVPPAWLEPETRRGEVSVEMEIGFGQDHIMLGGCHLVPKNWLSQFLLMYRATTENYEQVWYSFVELIMFCQNMKIVMTCE